MGAGGRQVGASKAVKRFVADKTGDQKSGWLPHRPDLGDAFGSLARTPGRLGHPVLPEPSAEAVDGDGTGHCGP